jgi:hypothetical protein
MRAIRNSRNCIGRFLTGVAILSLPVYRPRIKVTQHTHARAHAYSIERVLSPFFLACSRESRSYEVKKSRYRGRKSESVGVRRRGKETRVCNVHVWTLSTSRADRGPKRTRALPQAK